MNEVKLQISQESQRFSYGEPVTVNASIINNSTEKIVLWRSMFFYNHRIIIKNKNGEVPAMTENGRKLLALFDPSGERLKNYPLEILPGQEDKTLEPVKLTDLYILKPGQYFLKILYEDSQCTGFSGLLCSNEIQFEVAAQKKP
jgi:hypothetical protein